MGKQYGNSSGPWLITTRFMPWTINYGPWTSVKIMVNNPAVTAVDY